MDTTPHLYQVLASEGVRATARRLDVGESLLYMIVRGERRVSRDLIDRLMAADPPIDVEGTLAEEARRARGVIS